MFGPELDRAILTRAKETSEEICGYVMDGEAVFVPNASDDPTQEFLIRHVPDGAQAIFHSHPDGPHYPSMSDMAGQYATALPWGIACYSELGEEVVWFGDEMEHPPLIGRGFRHGVTDCYELIRHFYCQVHSKKLIWVPRDWKWWQNGDDFYMTLFGKAGFHEVEFSDIVPGDVLLFRIASRTTNHAAIYLGDGLMLHHPSSLNGFDPTRLSTVEPAARWMSFIQKAIRHEDNHLDRTAGQGIWPPV
jgi:proteasome lid subunit RPN8/RPN11